MNARIDTFAIRRPTTRFCRPGRRSTPWQAAVRPLRQRIWVCHGIRALAAHLSDDPSSILHEGTVTYISGYSDNNVRRTAKRNDSTNASLRWPLLVTVAVWRIAARLDAP